MDGAIKPGALVSAALGSEPLIGFVVHDEGVLGVVVLSGVFDDHSPPFKIGLDQMSAVALINGKVSITSIDPRLAYQLTPSWPPGIGSLMVGAEGEVAILARVTETESRIYSLVSGRAIESCDLTPYIGWRMFVTEVGMREGREVARF